MVKAPFVVVGFRHPMQQWTGSWKKNLKMSGSEHSYQDKESRKEQTWTLKIWVKSWQGTSCNIKAARRNNSVADQVSLDVTPETTIDASSHVIMWIWLSLTVLLKYLAGHVTFRCTSSSKAAQSILLILQVIKINLHLIFVDTKVEKSTWGFTGRICSLASSQTSKTEEFTSMHFFV